MRVVDIGANAAGHRAARRPASRRTRWPPGTGRMVIGPPRVRRGIARGYGVSPGRWHHCRVRLRGSHP